MKLNHELITKARKGEIAILNDGSAEGMYAVVCAVWPDDKYNHAVKEGKKWKYYYSNSNFYGWGRDNKTHLPAHSVKHFFMPDTKTIKGSEGGNEYIQINGGVDAEPRTYKVTRQQMKQIWEAVALEGFKPFVIDVTRQFDPFEDFGVISEADVSTIVAGLQEKSVILRSIWPEYFHIPEREPVLVRAHESHPWMVRVSDGKGGVYAEAYLSGERTGFKFIIPFTKNPPK